MGGSGVDLNGDQVTAENGDTVTLKMQLDGNSLVFLEVAKGNQAPTVSQKGDTRNNSIDIGAAGNTGGAGSGLDAAAP